MTRIEILLSVVLIVIGIVCLTMSGSMLFQQDLSFYFETFLKICLWMGIPILITGLIYLLIKRKRR